MSSLSVADPRFVAMLERVEVVSMQSLGKYKFMMFGSGIFAKEIYKSLPDNVTAIIEHPENINNKSIAGMMSCMPPKEATGVVLLATKAVAFKLNQMKALATVASNAIEKILIIDPCISQSNLDVKSSKNRILLFEHGRTILRHLDHLKGFRKYFSTTWERPVVSICPLTLYFYHDLWHSPDVFVWGGQREVHQIIDIAMPKKKKTYLEYGFFPQSSYFYMDKKGVNQECSLMDDDLSWIDKTHLKKLDEVKKQFLRNYSHKGSNYVLVPLQVPDDANVVNCSRFNRGMQDFIDFIDSNYSERERIVFKAHPKDPHRNDYVFHGREVSDLPFLELLQHAKHVHGITSSTLFESVMAGVDVIFEGNSLLSKHVGNHKKLLAGMVDRQASIIESDLAYWLDKYSHVSL